MNWGMDLQINYKDTEPRRWTAKKRIKQRGNRRSKMLGNHQWLCKEVWRLGLHLVNGIEARFLLERG